MASDAGSVRPAFTGSDPDLTDALKDILDPRQMKLVLARLRPVLGVVDVKPGQPLPPVNLDPKMLQSLLASALIVAAGLDPARTASPPPPVLWDDGKNRLLVHLVEARLNAGDGFVDLTVNVECDQTQRAPVTCTFVTSSPDRSGGFVWATEDRPRGPMAVVDVWGEALIALCWRALIEVARVGAGRAGTDTFGRPLIASTVVASPDGLQIVPMGAHRFMKIG
jgi:hypothetical protein